MRVLRAQKAVLALDHVMVRPGDGAVALAISKRSLKTVMVVRRQMRCAPAASRQVDTACSTSRCRAGMSIAGMEPLAATASPIQVPRGAGQTHGMSTRKRVGRG
jgi:hypothetical protein